MDFFTFKALHFIAIVAWFAALFYLVRLLIYHTEAQDENSEKRKILSEQFEIMEKRLLFGIGYPAMLATVGFGLSLYFFNLSYYSFEVWFLLKMLFVLGLIAYHGYCHRLINQMKRGVFKHSSFFLRILNEVATVFLVAIVFLAVLKNANSLWHSLLGLVLFTLVLLSAIFLYRRWRNIKSKH